MDPWRFPACRQCRSWHSRSDRRARQAARTDRACRARRRNQPACCILDSARLHAGRALACSISRKAPAGYGELLRRRSRRNQRVIVECRREPLLRLGHAPALARGVVLDLIALDLADAEIMALGMAEVEPAHGSARPHGEALGELEADAPLAVEQRKQARLLAVVGLRGIAGRRANAAVFFPDQLHAAERLLRCLPPEFPAHPLVQALGEGFG